MDNLRAKFEVYNEDTGEVIERFDTYVAGKELYNFEMVEMELGSLQRRLAKKLKDNQEDNG